jgi:hypothetical protein
VGKGVLFEFLNGKDLALLVFDVEGLQVRADGAIVAALVPLELLLPAAVCFRGVVAGEDGIELVPGVVVVQSSPCELPRMIALPAGQ